MALLASTPRVTFTIPAGMRQDKDPTTVTMQEVSVGQRLMANQVAQGDDERLGWELVKHSVVAFNGNTMGWEEKDKAVEACSARVRSLLLKGYTKLNVAAPKDIDSFFASATVTV